MRPPDFIGTSFSRCGFTYDHLDKDEWAITMFNLTVAASESELRPQLDAWLLELPLWHEQVMRNLDPEGDLLTEGPPPWRAAVSYARSVMETVCDVVAARAESADELVQFPNLLGRLEGNFAGHYFEVHLRNWADSDGLQTVFHRFVRTELRRFRQEQAVRAWHMYHARLNGVLQSGPGHSGETAAKAAIRAAVVSPILAARKWTPNRWASESGVSKNCAYEYLAGSRDLSAENRVAMAQELGLTPEQLPNG
jgi:hypothetical protein